MGQNSFHLMEQASEMSKITLSVIVYAPCLNKTTIKPNKKQMISTADTFFWMTRYRGKWKKKFIHGFSFNQCYITIIVSSYHRIIVCIYQLSPLG